MFPKSRTFICRELRSFAADDLEAISHAFQPATPCHLRQAWREKEEADFEPAIVRIGWRGDSLLVFAELDDADIFTNATEHNQRMWKLGDTFEMFLQPVEERAYAEFHVTPNNLRLQLRYPDWNTIQRVRKKIGLPEDYLIRGEAFHSATWIRPDERKWFVFARIPVQSVCDNPKAVLGSPWFFSFSRYDFSRSRDKPILSSTSPHLEPDFHRPLEWATMKFCLF